MVCHAPCSSTIFIYLLVDKVWSCLRRRVDVNAPYFDTFISFSCFVVAYLTKRGDRGNENDRYNSNGSDGRPSGIFMCWSFLTLSYLCRSGYLYILH